MLLALAWALPAACGADESLTPAKPSVAAPDAGATAPLPVPVLDASLPTKAKRSVSTRNPFGNVAVTDNLLWDGDFEWSSAFAQQYGWVNATIVVTYSAFDQIRPDSACRSGLKCGFMTQSQRIAAVGVAPAAGQSVAASVWVKPPGGACSEVGATLISCDYDVDADVELADADGLPDASGWCHLEAVGGPRERATCLYVESRFDEGEALLDDAVVRGVSGSVANKGSAPSASARAELGRTRARLRERLRPAPAAPTPVRVAFEAWMQRAR